MRAFSCFLILGLCCATGATSTVKAAPPQGELDWKAFTQWVDHGLPVLMKKHKVTGVSAAFVYKDKVLLRGFGYASLAKKQKVDPVRSLFRPGSISKLFTWIALMQLREKGKVDFNVPIQTYLKGVSLPVRFSSPKPLTIHHLMTHTPGFDDQLIGLLSLKPSAKKTLFEAVTTPTVVQVRPPGEAVAYSNYGTMLGGLIIQKVSGMSFAAYIKHHIWKPLKMDYVTFAQPPSGELSKWMASGYAVVEKEVKPKPFEIIQGAPAGGLSASARAMSRLMASLLSKQPSPLFQKPQTRQEMFSCSRAFVKGHCVFSHGWMTSDIGAMRMVGHGGDTIFFHSYLGLLRQQDFGFYLSTNSSRGSLLVYEWVGRMFLRFFKEKRSPLPKPPKTKAHKERILGTFTSNRRSVHDITKLMGLMTRLRIRPGTKPGSIVFQNPLLGSEEVYWRRSASEYIDSNGLHRLYVRRDKSGAVRSLLLGVAPVMEWTRVPWWESWAWNGGLLVFFSIAFLISLILPPSGLWQGKRWVASELDIWARWLARGHHLALVLGFVAVTLALDLENIIFVVPPTWTTKVFWVLLPFVLGLLCVSALTWVRKVWRVHERIWFSLLSLSTLGFLWFVLYWKLAH